MLGLFGRQRKGLRNLSGDSPGALVVVETKSLGEPALDSLFVGQEMLTFGFSEHFAPMVWLSTHILSLEMLMVCQVEGKWFSKGIGVVNIPEQW